MAGSQFFVRSTDDVDGLIERDGQFIGISSFRDRKFVLRPATQGDELVALVSALEAAGRIKWNELDFTQIEAPRYEAVLPVKGDWKVTLSHRYHERSCYHLFLSNEGSPGACIHHPQEVIRNLYNRAYESYGRSFFRIDTQVSIPELREIYEEGQAVIKAGLLVLRGITDGL